MSMAVGDPQHRIEEETCRNDTPLLPDIQAKTLYGVLKICHHFVLSVLWHRMQLFSLVAGKKKSVELTKF